MKLPSADEYVEFIDSKIPESLAILHNYKFLKDKEIYLNVRGSNNIIFKAEFQSKFYAVRFFLNDNEELFRRYHEVENFLGQKTFSWNVPFRFIDEKYPVIVMDWIDSLSFTEYLDLIIGDPSCISKLQQKLVFLWQELEGNGIGHGNLNMKHVRFVKQGGSYVLKLIDYDSMFIPAFKGKSSFSVGSAGFKHPMRLGSDFSQTIDRFSFWVFITALEAFKIDPSLWLNAKKNGFDKKEQILFTYRSLAFPEQSGIFQILRGYKNAVLNFYLDKLGSFCVASSLDQIESPQLYKRKSAHYASDKQRNARESKTVRKGIFIKEPDFSHAGIIPQQKDALNKKPGAVEEKDIEIPHAKQKIRPGEDKKTDVAGNGKKKKPITATLIILVVLLFATAYIAWNNQSKKNDTVIAPALKPTLKLQEPVQTGKVKETTVFTSPNINQFLSQLYQSYNRRDLSAILSNYADSLTQYYDAGSLSKNKLGEVIKNLFITPAYYECKPLLKTLQVQNESDHCKLTVDINEKVKAYRRSKTEYYSSKIEYIIDTSFKITAEKNIK